MPAQVDGEVRIGARIDTSSIKQDSERLAKSVNSVFSNYAKDSKSANANLMSLQNQMRKYADALNKAKTERAKIASTEIYSDNYKKMEADLNNYYKKLDETKAKISSVEAEQKKLEETKVFSPVFTKRQEEIAKLKEQFYA